MRCPLCPDSVLVVSHRHGIEVDHCPTCRGVWLDRGELDHLVETVAERLGPRPAVEAPGPQQPPVAPRPMPAGERYDARRDDRYDQPRWDDRAARGGKRKKRKHAVLDLLEDVLDF